MRWIERVKTMIRSWLEIQPASGKGLVIREPVSFETNVLRNRIWYRGDACELDQLRRRMKASARPTAACRALWWIFWPAL